MSEQKKSAAHESLFHLTKRTEVNPASAMLIRVIAIVLGMLVCGLTAFLLIEKLHTPGVKPRQVLLNTELIIRESTQK